MLPAGLHLTIPFISLGVSIKGNRLFGNTPLTPTYLCLWEIDVDDVAGCLHSTLINGLKRAVRAFKFNYSDMENAPLWLYAPPVDPDGKLQTCAVYTRMADDLAFSSHLLEGLGYIGDSDDAGGRLCSSAVCSTNFTADERFGKLRIRQYALPSDSEHCCPSH